MSGFKSYKIRDGVHIPSEKYKENWDSIFGKKPKKPTNGGLMEKTINLTTQEAEALRLYLREDILIKDRRPDGITPFMIKILKKVVKKLTMED